MMFDECPRGAVTDPPLDVVTKAVLDWCNQIRTELDLPALTDLRPGARLNPWFCPVCRTIGAGLPAGLQPEFAGDVFRLWCGPKLLRLEARAPRHVADWSEAFDRGHHPRFAMSRAAAFRVGWQ
jgi:hypothetical protein